MSRQWYQARWVAIALHILFWVLFFISPVLLQPVVKQDKSFFQRNLQGFISLHLLTNCLRVLLFYANANLFVPRFFYPRRFGQYALTLLAALAVMLGVDAMLFTLLIEGSYNIWNFLAFNLAPYIFIVIASLAFRTIRDRMIEAQRLQEQQNEHLKTELSFLRSQVSPHFMFNVLNNMVALARKKSDLLEPSLIKLSGLLRYMLYETDAQRVPLSREVTYLQSYIDLQQQRFGPHVTVTTELNYTEGGHTIEPMLLIPFVENAFKHGTGGFADGAINVSLRTEGNTLHFSVANRFDPAAAEVKDQASGIGLPNVQRRLELQYDGQHDLRIQKEEGWFRVQLQIQLAS